MLISAALRVIQAAVTTVYGVWFHYGSKGSKSFCPTFRITTIGALCTVRILLLLLLMIVNNCFCCYCKFWCYFITAFVVSYYYDYAFDSQWACSSKLFLIFCYYPHFLVIIYNNNNSNPVYTAPFQLSMSWKGSQFGGIKIY